MANSVGTSRIDLSCHKIKNVLLHIKIHEALLSLGPLEARVLPVNGQVVEREWDFRVKTECAWIERLPEPVLICAQWEPCRVVITYVV